VAPLNQFGKLMLYQLSYARMVFPASNLPALPTFRFFVW
jgi:hypothetical protein